MAATCLIHTSIEPPSTTTADQEKSLYDVRSWQRAALSDTWTDPPTNTSECATAESVVRRSFLVTTSLAPTRSSCSRPCSVVSCRLSCTTRSPVMLTTLRPARLVRPVVSVQNKAPAYQSRFPPPPSLAFLLCTTSSCATSNASRCKKSEPGPVICTDPTVSHSASAPADARSLTTAGAKQAAAARATRSSPTRDGKPLVCMSLLCVFSFETFFLFWNPTLAFFFFPSMSLPEVRRLSG